MMNDQHQRLILRMNDLARDFQNTKGFLIDELAAPDQRPATSSGNIARSISAQ
jgi:hypothetical protein